MSQWNPPPPPGTSQTPPPVSGGFVPPPVPGAASIAMPPPLAQDNAPASEASEDGDNNRLSGKANCPGCGAQLHFAPGQKAMMCNSCGTQVDIEVQERTHAQEGELDLDAHLEALQGQKQEAEVRAIRCDGCGAQTTFEASDHAKACAFCGAPLVAQPEKLVSLRPQWVLPFALKGNEVKKPFEEWVKTRWFAPNAFKKLAKLDAGLQGIYAPHFTFDAKTFTHYTGERGVRHTRTVGSGKNRRTETYVVWHPASGSVRVNFDDVLVPATRSVKLSLLRQLNKWNLSKMLAYNEQLLAGFKAELPSLTLPEADAEGRDRMTDGVRRAVEHDIGGDQQRIHHMDINWSDRTFKLCLLPLWVSSCRFKSKTYQILVDAHSGQVAGERPYSAVKITFAVLAGLAATYGLYQLFY